MTPMNSPGRRQRKPAVKRLLSPYPNRTFYTSSKWFIIVPSGISIKSRGKACRLFRMIENHPHRSQSDPIDGSGRVEDIHRAPTSYAIASATFGTCGLVEKHHPHIVLARDPDESRRHERGSGTLSGVNPSTAICSMVLSGHKQISECLVGQRSPPRPA
jgi:hypothetical protein